MGFAHSAGVNLDNQHEDGQTGIDLLDDSQNSRNGHDQLGGPEPQRSNRAGPGALSAEPDPGGPDACCSWSRRPQWLSTISTRPAYKLPSLSRMMGRAKEELSMCPDWRDYGTPSTLRFSESNSASVSAPVSSRRFSFSSSPYLSGGAPAAFGWALVSQVKINSMRGKLPRI